MFDTVLDNFDRTNGALGANWTSPFVSGYDALEVFSNEAREFQSGFGFNSSYWSASTFGPNCEAFMKIAAKGTNSGRLAARIQSPGVAGMDCYFMRVDSFNSYLYKIIDGTETLLGASFSTIPVAGDDIGIRCEGTTIEAWYRPAAGSWTQIGTRTDSSISAAGYIGIWTDSTDKTWRFDNFGGGTLVSARNYLRIVGPSYLNVFVTDLYTVPVGKRARILHTHITNTNTLGSFPCSVRLSIGTDAAATRIYDDYPIQSQETLDTFTPYDLAEGEKIQGWTTCSNKNVITITGYEEPA